MKQIHLYYPGSATSPDKLPSSSTSLRMPNSVCHAPKIGHPSKAVFYAESVPARRNSQDMIRPAAVNVRFSARPLALAHQNLATPETVACNTASNTPDVVIV